MIPIPRALLARRPPPPTDISAKVVEESKSSAPARDFAGSTRQAVETLSCGEHPDTIRDGRGRPRPDERQILDLALDLGYSDHANFTRAFRRGAGCSPQEYRARQARRRRVRGARHGVQ
jgi:AraC-like DNA-binding protein